MQTLFEYRRAALVKQIARLDGKLHTVATLGGKNYMVTVDHRLVMIPAEQPPSPFLNLGPLPFTFRNAGSETIAEVTVDYRLKLGATVEFSEAMRAYFQL